MAVRVDEQAPVIGICAAWDRAAWSFWNQDAALVAGSYLDVVLRGGGLPLVLPPIELGPAAERTLLERIDGLLLIGGSDLDPASYGEAPAPRLEATSALRDAFELALVRGAIARDLPVLGICRGLQILNVATGGTLEQDLAGAGFGEHRPAPGRLDEPTFHAIEVEPESLLAAGPEPAALSVNSHHHQGVARLGEGARVIARSPDGVVEALEWPDREHVLGVQWHPEALELDTTVSAFVAAAEVARTQEVG
jgi:putative glutamine amidotransferase